VNVSEKIKVAGASKGWMSCRRNVVSSEVVVLVYLLGCKRKKKAMTAMMSGAMAMGVTEDGAM